MSYGLLIRDEDGDVTLDSSTEVYSYVDVVNVPPTSPSSFSKVASPSTPIASSASCCAFHPSGKYIAVAFSTAPYVHVYAWDDATGFGSKVSDPAVAIPSAPVCIAWAPDGTALVVGVSATPYITAYAWTGTAFGNKLAPPVSAMTSAPVCIDFRQDGAAVLVPQSSSLAAYTWSPNGFGSKFTQSMPSGRVAVMGAFFSRCGTHIFAAFKWVSNQYGGTDDYASYPFSVSSGIGAIAGHFVPTYGYLGVFDGKFTSSYYGGTGFTRYPNSLGLSPDSGYHPERVVSSVSGATEDVDLNWSSYIGAVDWDGGYASAGPGVVLFAVNASPYLVPYRYDGNYTKLVLSSPPTSACVSGCVSSTGKAFAGVSAGSPYVHAYKLGITGSKTYAGLQGFTLTPVVIQDASSNTLDADVNDFTGVAVDVSYADGVPTLTWTNITGSQGYRILVIAK